MKSYGGGYLVMNSTNKVLGVVSQLSWIAVVGLITGVANAAGATIWHEVLKDKVITKPEKEPIGFRYD